jgi:catechol 2,3-dioxygenase-like lactoylglutathione lyase family enzyme
LQIHHFGVKVKNVEAALNFYCDVLGFSLQETVSMGGQNYYFVSDGFMSLEIEQSFQPGERTCDNGFSHIAITVDDLEAYCRSLKAQAVKFQLEPSQFRPDRKIAFIEDSEGNAIQLIEIIK